MVRNNCSRTRTSSEERRLGIDAETRAAAVALTQLLADNTAASGLVAMAPQDPEQDEDAHEERVSSDSTRKTEEGDSDDEGEPEKVASKAVSENEPSDDHSDDTEIASEISLLSSQGNWNRIIPVPARSVRVGNGIDPSAPRAPRAGIPTPIPAGQTITAAQQNVRLWALRHLLGECVGFSDAVLQHILRESRFDLGTALRRCNDLMNAARQREWSQAEGRSAAQRESDYLLGAESLHHNRRRGVDALYRRLNVIAEPEERRRLTTLAVASLLADNGFVLERAVDAFLIQRGDREVQESADRRQRRLRLRSQNQCHQDQRVARFMEITSTDDYYAALSLLTSVDFDLLRALDGWMVHGLPRSHIDIPRNVRRMATFRPPILLHTDAENLWPSDRPHNLPLPRFDFDDLAEAALDYGQGRYQKRHGWFVRYPRPALQVGVHIPTLLRAYTVQGGRLKVQSREANTDPNETVNWNDQESVGDFGKIISQWFRRITGEVTKERGQPFHTLENKWILCWHRRRLQALLRGMDAEQAANHQPIQKDFPKALLTRDFNRRFSHRYLPDTVDNPREPRSQASLDIQRHRIRRLCREFGFKFAPAHPRNIAHSEPGDSCGEHPDTCSEESDKEDEPQTSKTLVKKRGAVKKRKRIAHKPESSASSALSDSESSPEEAAKKGKRVFRRRRLPDQDEDDKVDSKEADKSWKCGPKRRRRGSSEDET